MYNWNILPGGENTKKLIVLFVILLFTTSNTHTSYAERLFIDVDETSPYYTEIKYLYDLGVVDNTTSGFYSIDEDADRSQVIVMLGKALGLDGTKRKTSFKDVPTNHYASGYIQSAVDAGIVNGYTDGTFRPYDKLNRGHISAFIERSFRQSLPVGNHLEFKDVKSNHTAYQAVKKMAAANITTGYPDGTFRPQINLTRKHLTTFMYRTMKFLDKEVPTKEYSKTDLEAYLMKKYAVLQTKLIDVNFDIRLYENDSKSINYDYHVALGFDSMKFEQTMNAHLRSIKHTATAELDVLLARKQLNVFLEEMALDIIQKAPKKKILGQNYESGYKYDALKLGRHYRKNYSWTNYTPLQMKQQWPGNQPDDYWQVMSALRDPSDSKVIQYSKDERSRSLYSSEYITLNYDDFQITDFGWRTYLDAVYYDPKYY